MHEIAPGVVHWSVPHPRIGQDVDSFLLAERGVLLNPMLPPDGLEPLRTGPWPMATRWWGMARVVAQAPRLAGM